MIEVKDFFSEWCGPCKTVSSTLDRLIEKYPDVKIEKIDVEENDELVEQYGIMNVPTLIYFKDGVEVKRTTGLQNVQQIEDILKEL